MRHLFNKRFDGPRTLATCFDPHRNSLNALRLFLALLVIVSHAWPLGGFGREPHIGSVSLGAWAVQGFFVISGFLITGSRLRSPFAPYLWRRFLRIFPGLWVCLLATALVFAPVAALLEDGDDELGVRPLAAFVAHNGVLERGQLQLGETLSGVPFPFSWNGSLWTLFYEFSCYLLVGGLLLARWRSVRRPLAASAFAVCTAFQLGVSEFGLNAPESVATLAQLGMYFFAGSMLYTYADRVPVRADLAVGCIAIVLGSAFLGHDAVVAALPLAYLSVWCGIVLPFERVGRRNDISYGVYIYAFPIQQLLAVVHVPSLGIVAYITVSVGCTLPLAAASWFAVERPAMRLKSSAPFRLRYRPVPVPRRPSEPGGGAKSPAAR